MTDPTPTGSENSVITAIRGRRSVRRYRKESVSREVLSTIVDCGRLAPSASNKQSWEFVVVTNPEALRRLAEVTTYGKFITDAAACIVVCGAPSNRSVYLDGAAATQNMLLAIHSMGLASCWVQGFEKEYNQQIKYLLKIPERLVLVSLVPVGIPSGETASPQKRRLDEVLHWETF